MRAFKQMDILASTRINETELSSEIQVEISVLKGLDIFTNAHVKGVAKMTTAICQKLKMSYPELKRCVLAAYLHDVGKIKISPDILQKNGKLTDEEFAEMKKHTVYGYEICMDYINFKDLAGIVRAHHENLDGTGYPDGLKGLEIPKEASIIKVADVYDALTKRRQYKDGYLQSEALKIMLNDVKAGKMSAQYFLHLLMVVIEDLTEKLETHERNVVQYQNNLEILHELERIYKQIYDQGLTRKLEKKLKRYDLEPGYDMSTNANLLIIKQKSLEKEVEWRNLCESEVKSITELFDEAFHVMNELKT